MGLFAVIRRVISRPAAPTVPPAAQAYRDSLARLHAERETELRAELAAESPESKALRRDIERANDTIARRPTTFARRLRTLR